MGRLPFRPQRRPMKVLLAAGEAVPFCKTGGLADVVGALGQKLGAAGHDVCLFLPNYRAVEAPVLQGGLAYPLEVPLGGERIRAKLRYMQWRAVSVYFIDHPPFYDREGLYGREGRDHPDNAQRFILFCRAVLEGSKAVGFKPDVVHAHDWQAGLLAAYLRKSYAADPFFSRTGCVFTIHNMAYQGNFPKGSLAAAGFGPEEFTPERLEYYGKFSFLKAGLVYADLLSTVSPSYAREIQTSAERGFGMEGLLRRRSSDLQGILNGIDTEIWDPGKDHRLPRTYGPRDFAEGKAACKKALQEECGLKAEPKTPLVAIVSRLDYQKGLDLAIAALEPRLGRLQLAVLGTGDASLHEAFAALSRRRAGRVHFHSGFDDAFAHRLYAGADLFLMPSRFEPCGLGQMISMRYGCVPVASRTGGLSDTVFEEAAPGRSANGFLAEPGDAEDLGRALDRALKAFAQPSWARRVRSAMGGDFSWDKSVAAYLDLYRKACERAKAAGPVPS